MYKTDKDLTIFHKKEDDKVLFPVFSSDFYIFVRRITNLLTKLWLMTKEKKPAVLLLYTGGTIGMIENPETGALESFRFDELLKQVPELKRFHYRIDTYSFQPAIDSSDMEPELWGRIVRIITENYEHYDGFVILHGTDTMAYTASALSFMLENLSKPVILTGSQLPIGKLRTDGKENLITAIEIAAAKRENGQPMVPEVCIFFENELLRGNRTTKVNAENFNAFRSFNYPPLATVGIHIRFNEHLIRKNDFTQPLKPHFNFNNQVVMLSLFPAGASHTTCAVHMRRHSSASSARPLPAMLTLCTISRHVWMMSRQDGPPPGSASLSMPSRTAEGPPSGFWPEAA